MAARDSELALFVRDALMHGQARADIEAALCAAGWSSRQARVALAAYAPGEFAVPVPVPRSFFSAREAFLHLVLFTALGLSAYYFGALVFELIDTAFPDATERARSFRWHEHDVRFAVSTLVVAFPLYLAMAWKTGSDAARWVSGARKWLTYIALFIASTVIVGDLIGLIYQYLAGDLTVRVGLKLLTVGLIAGAIFLYYLRSAVRDGTAD